MRGSIIASGCALALVAAACGNSGSGDADDPDPGSSSSSTDAGHPGDASSPTSKTTAGDAAAPGAGRDASVAPATDAGDPDGGGALASITMPRISAGAPAFSSGNDSAFSGPSNANDDDSTTAWVPDKLPAWIAYDVSAAPVSERGDILVVWNAEHAGSYLNTTSPSGAMMPTDYTLEVNPAPGGTAAPPSSGWVTVATVSGNLRNTVESPVSLAGGNWVRMSITGATDPQVAIDVDVFSTPEGASDAWMLMGDSITYLATGYAFSDLPQLVHADRQDRWPAVIDAAIGGTSTTTALLVIDDTMSGFPGRYVGLAYGTNDHPVSFAMESLVQKVIAAGKVPVVPHIPWQDDPTMDADIETMNAAIDALYAKYPQILKGPDLWATFFDHPELYPDAGGPHPDSAGQEVQRKAWATMMAAVP